MEAADSHAPETLGQGDFIVPEPEPAVNLQTALAAATRGWRVFPLHPGSKRPVIGNWPTRASADAEQVTQWWEPSPNLGVGIATGAGSNLVVIDVDGATGEATLKALEAQHGPLPTTGEVSTPNGRHLYFCHPGGYVKCSAGKLGADLDVRGDGGQVVAYSVPSDELAALPAGWLAALQSEPPQAKVTPPNGAGLQPTTGYGASALAILGA